MVHSVTWAVVEVASVCVVQQERWWRPLSCTCSNRNVSEFKSRQLSLKVVKIKYNQSDSSCTKRLFDPCFLLSSSLNKQILHRRSWNTVGIWGLREEWRSVHVPELELCLRMRCARIRSKNEHSFLASKYYTNTVECQETKCAHLRTLDKEALDEVHCIGNLFAKKLGK